MSSTASILIVHRSSLVRELCTEMFCGQGVRVSLAHDGHTGLLHLGSRSSVQPDVIVAGMVLPDMSGVDLLARYRALPHVSHAPFVFVSSTADEVVMHAAYAAGAADFIAASSPFAIIEARLRVHMRAIQRIRALMDRDRCWQCTHQRPRAARREPRPVSVERAQTSGPGLRAWSRI